MGGHGLDISDNLSRVAIEIDFRGLKFVDKEIVWFVEFSLES